MPLSFVFTATSGLYLLAGIIFWGARVPGHRHLRNTISELGEVGSDFTRQVSWGLFLPVGVLLLAAGFLEGDGGAARGLAYCLGTGYVVAAFFPCDAGSPLTGSSRQQIHNVGGFVEYAGGTFFLFRAAESGSSYVLVDYKIAAMIVFAGIVLISIPRFLARGLVQRVLEVVLFACLLQLTWWPIG